MENEHVLGGLIRKRAEIAGAPEEAQSRVRRLVAETDAVDTTIRLFSADVDWPRSAPSPCRPGTRSTTARSCGRSATPCGTRARS
jgi:hypothetical protein